MLQRILPRRNSRFVNCLFAVVPAVLANSPAACGGGGSSPCSSCSRGHRCAPLTNLLLSLPICAAALFGSDALAHDPDLDSQSHARHLYASAIRLVHAAADESELPNRYALLKDAERKLTSLAENYPVADLGTIRADVATAAEATWKRFCEVPAPTYQCAVARALAAARTIVDDHWRAVALRSILRLQLETGDYDGALATAHWMDFLGWSKHWALRDAFAVFTENRNASEGHPGPGELIDDHLDTSLFRGANVPSGGVDTAGVRARAYTDIVLALAKSGKGQKALEAARFIRHVGFRRSALFDAALWLASRGSTTEALTMADEYAGQNAARNSRRAHMQQYIALLLARASKTAQAIEIAESIQVSDSRDLALGGVALVLAKGGRSSEALDIVERIAYTPYRERVRLVALAQSGKSDEAVALAAALIREVTRVEEQSNGVSEASAGCRLDDNDDSSKDQFINTDSHALIEQFNSLPRRLASEPGAMRDLRVIYWAANALLADGMEDEARALVLSVDNYPCRSEFLYMLDVIAERFGSREKTHAVPPTDAAESAEKEESLAKKLAQQTWDLIQGEDERDPVYRLRDILRVAADLADLVDAPITSDNDIKAAMEMGFSDQRFLLYGTDHSLRPQVGYANF